MPIRILIVDDHTVMREGLRSLLERYPEFEVVAEAGGGESAVGLVGEFKPDIVIMDVAMRGLNGIEATRRIIAEAPAAKVIALTVHSERHTMEEMLKAGASGYLLKERAFEDLADAIREVAAGNSYLSDDVPGMASEGRYVHKRGAKDATDLSALTCREREVLQLIAEGRSTAQIAAALDISVKTVDTHRQHIMDKLNIRGIAELTRYAIREGITRL